MAVMQPQQLPQGIALAAQGGLDAQSFQPAGHRLTRLARDAIGAEFFLELINSESSPGQSISVPSTLFRVARILPRRRKMM